MRRLLWFVLVWVLAACGAGAGEQSSSTVELSPTTSQVFTTTTLAHTTTAMAEPVDICRGRPVLWDPGVTYSADCFFVPLAVRPVDGGWRSFGASKSALFFTWIGDDRSTGIRMAVLAFEPELAVDEALDAIVGIDGVHPVETRRSAMFGGVEGLVQHVRTDPARTPGVGTPLECSRGGQWALNWPDTSAPGYRLMRDTTGDIPREYGLGACRDFRVLVVEVDGRTITILATPDDADRFEELAPVIDRLFDSVTFGASQ